jgi:hypothetical protein
MANVCAAKTQLLLTYTDAAKKYCEAVTELHDRLGTIPKDEADRLYQIAEAHRASSEDARLVMEKHVREHGC